MIISVSNNRNMIGIRYRNEENERVEYTTSFDDFKPYFYILDTAQEIREAVIKDKYTKFRATVTLNYEETDEVKR